MAGFTESVVEEAALAWLESLGYKIKHQPAPQNDATRRSRQAGRRSRRENYCPSRWTTETGCGGLRRQLVQKMQQLKSWVISKKCTSSVGQIGARELFPGREIVGC